MPQHSKENILAGRNAVDAYRDAHRQLHTEPWHKDIPQEHTPLLDNLLAELEGQGFESLGVFFDTSQELNMQELGYGDRQDFEDKATATDIEVLERMWS
jgi:hypothetical protein